MRVCSGTSTSTTTSTEHCRRYLVSDNPWTKGRPRRGPTARFLVVGDPAQSLLAKWLEDAAAWTALAHQIVQEAFGQDQRRYLRHGFHASLISVHVPSVTDEFHAGKPPETLPHVPPGWYIAKGPRHANFGYACIGANDAAGKELIARLDAVKPLDAFKMTAALFPGCRAIGGTAGHHRLGPDEPWIITVAEPDVMSPASLIPTPKGLQRLSDDTYYQMVSAAAQQQYPPEETLL